MSNDHHLLDIKIDLLRELLHKQLMTEGLDEEDILNISRQLDEYILKYYKTNNSDCK